MKSWPWPWFVQHHRCIRTHKRWRHECLSWADASTSFHVNPHSLEVLLYHISPFHPWPARSSPESCNFPVQCLLRNAYFIHSHDMAKPLHPSFSDHYLKTYLSCSFPYFFICDFVPPGDKSYLDLFIMWFHTVVVYMGVTMTSPSCRASVL